MMKSIFTRFRAYHLGTPGSSFSYFADGHFTLLEGRLTEQSTPTLSREMEICSVSSIDVLHITSWDADHCQASELPELLRLTRPMQIECPGYRPHQDNGTKSLKIISEYVDERRNDNRKKVMRHITPEYIGGLKNADWLAYENTLYNPRHIDDLCPNDNSTVKHFRRGSFNVLSLGDVESHLISARLRRCKILRRETDVMILAHHGADNGFTNKPFLNHLEPSLAICSSDYANRYEHPRDNIRSLLHEQKIRLMTTKTGDVIVKSIDDHPGLCKAINLIGTSTKLSSEYVFHSKKRTLLSYNTDTIRQLYSPKPTYRSIGR